MQGFGMQAGQVTEEVKQTGSQSATCTRTSKGGSRQASEAGKGESSQTRKERRNQSLTEGALGQAGRIRG